MRPASKFLAVLLLIWASTAQAEGIGPSPSSGGGGGTPGGSNTQVQYNNTGAFGGITGATTNGVALTLVAPVLGTPASGTLTNTTGLPVSTGLSGAGTGVLTALAANVTGSGGIVLVTSPTLTTPTLGVASATSINKLTITAPATAATLTIADGKTLTASNTLTLTATDGSTLAIGTGGTLGTAAYVNTGTSGATIPLLNGANTWGAANTFSLGVYTPVTTGGFIVNLGGTAYIYGRTGSALTFGAGGAQEGEFVSTVFQLRSTGVLAFSSLNIGDATDATISRNAAGIIQIGTMGANASGDLIARTLKTAGFTVATLPTAGIAGRQAYVTDQLTTCAAIGVAPTGGGSVVCPVFDNGVGWVGG